MIKIIELLIDGIDYSEYATMPLQTQDTLDESLDVAYIELKGLERENPFLPFSDVLLKTEDSDGNVNEHYMFIESDTPTEIIPLKVYDHNVLIIEETKLLERFFVEKSVTNPLIHDYLKDAKGLGYINITFTELPTDNQNLVEKFLKENINLSFLKSPTLFNTTINIPNIVFNEPSLMDYTFSGGTLTIQQPNKTEVQITLQRDVSTKFTFNQRGTYRLYFNYTMRSSIDIAVYTFYVEVFSIDQQEIKNNYNIKEVLNILLQTTETLRKGETPKFLLAEINDAGYKSKSKEYKKRIQKIFDTISPEFYFSKMSLFEALKMVGDYAHFIPRMKNRKIYLDLLGMEDKVSGIQLEEYYSAISSQNSNNFCTKLDSQVNNFVNLDSDEQGSVTTPFNDGFRTLRVESGLVQITEGNIIIPTESPIEKIIKLEIGYLSDGTYVGDITPYVYESAEYEALSSYSNAYPNAKMYALKYTIGSPNITELSFERQNIINQALEGIAIKNIIQRKLNRNVNWWKSLWDNENTFNLQYRLTYIPNTSTRVTQVKAYKDNINKTISIAYNQSASKISSNAYGENLKGQILKLGNIEKQKMYVLPSLDLIPQCGQKFDDDYYISVVKCEYYPNFIKCEIGLSKDYNNKSAYVEVDSQLRFYEISEKIAFDIYRIYEDYCEIGFDTETDNMSLITDSGLDKFSDAFTYGYSDTNLTMVKAKSLDENNQSINPDYNAEFVLPVTSLGVGNSLLFEFHYEDNFSAGNTAYYETDLTIFTESAKIQQPQSYTNIYGEIPYLGLKYGKNTTIINNYSEAVQMGDNVPFANIVTSMETYFDTESNPIKLLKDNREVIHFTYQIHFVANNNDLVIGSGLARYSPFVTNETMNYKLVLLKERLNKFESEIDLTNSYSYDSISLNKDYENKKVKLSNVVAPPNETWKSWAIVQTIKNNDGETIKAVLILGENRDIKSGDIIEMPNFVFKHKIVEE